MVSSSNNDGGATAGSISAMPLKALDYDLPAERIATRPAEPRDSARLLVVRRSTATIEHRSVRDLPDYLKPDDALVLNDTAVIPARIEARRVDTGGRVDRFNKRFGNRGKKS